MTNQRLTVSGRTGMALLGLGAAAALGFSAPASAEPFAPCSSVDSTTTGSGGNQTSTSTGGGGGCVPEQSGPPTSGIGPGGPAYNGVDPRG
jgi:hypothetical protein